MGENKWLRVVDWIPANLALIEIIKMINDARKHNKIVFIYSIIHFYIALYTFRKGGWACCGERYKKYHTMWHILGGLGWLTMNVYKRGSKNGM
jgi:hypothetical protein